MYEFLIEAILIATFVVPLIARPAEPARVLSSSRKWLPCKLRRND